MLNAFKMYLAGEKPYSVDRVKGSIQADCLIVDAASEFLKEKDEYELYICSRNKSDFSENPDNREEIYIIAEDIKKKFLKVEYTPNLLQLLNDKFGYTFGESLLEMFNKETTEDKLKFQPIVASDIPYVSPNQATQAYMSSPAPGVSISEPIATIINHPFTILQSPQSLNCSNCGEQFYYYPPSSIGVATSVVTQHVYCTHCGHLNIIY
jgi:DNA-directed RNA polymerase subunit RPC12/RpoP